ncbi:MAG: RES domain-containing protein [Methylococcales bacterium]
MQVWRLCQAKHQATAFSGEGARLYGGRWHHKGQAAVYTASTQSLAALEILAHIDTDLIPNNFVAFAVDIPDQEIAITQVFATDLPSDWREAYPPLSCQLVGSQWLSQTQTAVLRVPSAIIPQEQNFILNPAHPDFSKLSIHLANAFNFDHRLWR